MAGDVLFWVGRGEEEINEKELEEMNEITTPTLRLQRPEL